MASINDLATAAIASSTAARSGVQAGDAPRPATADTGSGPSESKIAAAAGSTDAGSEVVRGALVVLEGLDRSGKTTQVKLLEQRFVELGRKVKVLRFPGMFNWCGSFSRLSWLSCRSTPPLSSGVVPR